MDPSSSSHRHRQRSRSPSSREDRHRKHRERSRDRDRDADDRRDHKRRKEGDVDKREVKKHRKDEKKRENRNKEKPPGIQVVDDDDENEWVEKDVDASVSRRLPCSLFGHHLPMIDVYALYTKKSSIANIPTSADLLLTSNPNKPPPKTSLPPAIPFETIPADNKREDWMLDPLTRGTVPPASLVDDDSAPAPHSASINENGQEHGRIQREETDFFSGMGSERVKKQREQKPDPDKVNSELITSACRAFLTHL
jgi:hypothetical protein